MILTILILLILNLLTTVVVGFFALAASAYAQKLFHVLAHPTVLAVPAEGLFTEVATIPDDKAN